MYSVKFDDHHLPCLCAQGIWFCQFCIVSAWDALNSCGGDNNSTNVSL